MQTVKELILYARQEETNGDKNASFRAARSAASAA